MTWVGLLQPVEGLDRTKTDPSPHQARRNPASGRARGSACGSSLGWGLLTCPADSDLCLHNCVSQSLSVCTHPVESASLEDPAIHQPRTSGAGETGVPTKEQAGGGALSRRGSKEGRERDTQGHRQAAGPVSFC